MRKRPPHVNRPPPVSARERPAGRGVAPGSRSVTARRVRAGFRRQLGRPGLPRQPGVRPQFVNPAALFSVVAGAIVAVVVAAIFSFGQRDFLSLGLATLGGVNLATFVLYAYDKAVAGRARVRVPEVVLHGLALSGGTVAAYLAQRLLRHKTIKKPFQRVFLGIAVIQTSVGIWLLLR